MEVKTFFAQRADGRALPRAAVSVLPQGEETLAAGLEDGRGQPLSNPFHADADGRIQFAAPNGHYVVEVGDGTQQQRLHAQFFDQGEIHSASGTQPLAQALDQRLVVVDSVDTLREWPGARVADGCWLVCRSFYRDRPFELDIQLQRVVALDDPGQANQMAWLPIDHPHHDDFHRFTLWAADGAAYVQPGDDIDLLKVGFRADYTDAEGSGSDESAWFQETLDKTPYRTKYLPDLPQGCALYLGKRRIALRSGTRLVGAGARANSRLVSDYVASGFRDGMFLLREPHVIAAWAEGRPQGDLDAAFSHDIHVSGLTLEARDFCRGAVALVCVRDAVYRDIHHVRCGGLKVFHELELNGRYSTREEDPESDNAVTAGFNPEVPDDLSERIRISDLSGGAGRYTLSPGDSRRAGAVRLNFVRDFSISHVHMDYCNVSGWGGSARPGKGGELRWMRRLRDGFIQDVHCRWTNGAIYFNNAHNIKVYGCSAKEVSDTAFDLEGCTYCLFDGLYAENAANFGISIFYATRGNVIKNFVARQSASAGTLHERLAEPKFGPGLGRTLFRRLAGFEDPDFSQDVTLDTGAFVYEGEGFGAVIVDSWADVTYRNVSHHDVVMDLRGHSNAQSPYLKDCRFTFTRPARDGDVLVALGTNRSDYGYWKGGAIVSEVPQPAGVVPLLGQLSAYAGTAIFDLDDLRIDVPGVETAIAVCDARQAGRRPGHAFRLGRNLIPAHSGITDLALNRQSGGDALQLDAGDNRTLDFSLVQVQALEEGGTRRYAALAFGLDVARGGD
ncbi:right-handed parallel beta-helix repeat-containing protein [Salinicola sp. DM10]|uniref:right-handed parallel beta-helix repeat-containing protein n=1 Tax=Salinicola sp. DM10 TaxID=2815721 RepID=UPI001A90B080|nr:right-handed parallel beta-helix repeat-containing protein [Salinicola sp. DM10]MCE3025578.1 right-handed parallel beta-helix repeat-containing protein [Salinicola sp. DM10]